MRSESERGAGIRRQRLSRSWAAGWVVLLLWPVLAGAQPLELNLRSLRPAEGGDAPWRSVEERVTWDPAQTALVICDMWDQHWCRGATERVSEMAARMNEVAGRLRDRGVLIIHCPSDTLAFYRGHPGLELARRAPKVDLAAIRDRGTEPALPIDDSDGGCDEDPACAHGSPWRRQTAVIEIRDGDAITDSVQAYYLMHQRGVTNVLIMGVHQNMCVLGRPFAIRQMVRLGQNVALVRDMTDSMYNSRRAPYVDHFTGNELVTWHIERYWCPTITSDQIVGGEPFRFAGDQRPARAFGSMAAALLGAPLVAAPSGGAERVVFEDRFEGHLGPGWEWLRENPDGWRIRDNGLEIRIEPGMADSVRNALVRPAPDRSRGRYAIEVTVRNLAELTEQYEQAGITWYSDGRPVLKLVKELVHGEGLIMIPSRKPMTSEMVQLRLIVSANHYIAQYRPDGQGAFQTAAAGPLEPSANEQVSLQAYHGPADRAHWVRFERFRIVRLEALAEGAVGRERE
jgi:nicotinamidase-related amidase